jgi:multicomponent Na+:H+ antiporter subunit A
MSGETPSIAFPWFPSLDISFALRLDGLGLLMGLLVTGIGTLIVLYASGYLHHHPMLGRFYLFLLGFMAAMLGIVISDDLIVLFVFWELTSITSYLLIGFNNTEASSRTKALQALLVTGLGAMAMLAGFILIGETADTWSLAEVLKSGDALRGAPFYTAIVVLVLGGAFTKSAQVPFHFWLPNAMAAPTPVSAYLHSATMVKAGVFLLARLNPALGGTPLWQWTLTLFGGTTLLLAVWLGLLQKDLKSILAYTTLGVLGMLTMLIGLGTEIAIQSMVVFLLGHALYKATLFMTSGSVDHETGTRDVTMLGGLRRSMPLTATAAMLAALSMAGFPPFFGFIGKEYVYKAGLGMEGVAQWALPVAFIGNVIMMALAFQTGAGPFFGRESHRLPKHPHEAPASMWFGPLLLGATGLVLGLFPSLVASALIAPAVSSIQGGEVALSLKLWHGINLPLIISLATLGLGLALFLARRKLWQHGGRILQAITPWGADAAYHRIFKGVVDFSKLQTRLIQSGHLHHYVFITAGTATLLLALALAKFSAKLPEFPTETFDALPAVLVVLMILATLRAATTNNRITALISLGVVGFGIAVLFLYFGAPDLAITQVLVDTLTVVLFMFVIYRLPGLSWLSSRRTRLRDALLAAVFGVCITLAVLQALAVQFAPPISGTLASMSYLEAKGKNIVNVILVDFRALDTLGEITVLAAAALGIAALVKSGLRRRKEKQ